jgi:hypothetical protein
VVVFSLVATTLDRRGGQYLQPLLMLPGIQQLGPDHAYQVVCRAVDASGWYKHGAITALQAVAAATVCASPHLLCMLQKPRTQQLKSLLIDTESMRTTEEAKQGAEQAANAAADECDGSSMVVGGGGVGSCGHSVHESPLGQLARLLRQLLDGM